MVRYGLNKLDVIVSYVRYDDQFRQVRLFDENGDVTAHVELKNVTRAEQLFTEEVDDLTGVFVQWSYLDLPVDRINDWGNKVSIMTEDGAAVEILFRKENGND